MSEEDWRSVVVKISQRLRKHDCKAVRFIYQLPDTCCSCKNDHLGPLDELQQRDKFSQSNPEGLELILKRINRFDLAKIVNDSYRDKRDNVVHSQLEQGKRLKNEIQKDLEELLLAEEDCAKKYCLSVQIERLEELDKILTQASGKELEVERIPKEESMAGHHEKAKLATERVQVLPTGMTQAMKLKGSGHDDEKKSSAKQPMMPPSFKLNPKTANSGNQQRSSPPPQFPAPQPPLPQNDPDYDEVDITTDVQKENVVEYYASTDLINKAELQHPIPESQLRHINVPDAVSQSAPSSPLTRHTQFSERKSRIPPPRRIPLVPPPRILQRRISKSFDALDTTSSDYSGSSSDYTGSGSADSGISDVTRWKEHKLSPQKDCLIRPSSTRPQQQLPEYTPLTRRTMNEIQYTNPRPKPAPRKTSLQHTQN